jgi:hypothetical protein
MDDLFNRADYAIRESRIVRDEIRKDLADARLAAERVRETVRRARIENEISITLYRETTGQAFARLERQTKLSCLPGEPKP